MKSSSMSVEILHHPSLVFLSLCFLGFGVCVCVCFCILNQRLVHARQALYCLSHAPSLHTSNFLFVYILPKNFLYKYTICRYLYLWRSYNIHTKKSEFLNVFKLLINVAVITINFHAFQIAIILKLPKLVITHILQTICKRACWWKSLVLICISFIMSKLGIFYVL
jgi:hypothetical protein